MKRVTALVAALLFVASTAFAVNFAPTVMKLTAPSIIHYEFDGSELSIPLDVKGKPANMVFMVYTKDQAADIPTVVNGYLGWHTVNKIDTCIYYALIGQHDIGGSVVKWNGKNNDAKAVGKGEYTYYLWGYDNVTPKSVAAPTMFASWHNIIICDHDPVTGAALNQPFMMGDETQDRSGGKGGLKGQWKWIVGNDPYDSTLIETTTYKMPWDGGERKTPAWSPYVEGNFFTMAHDKNGGTMHIRQFKWVPNGESTQITEWGDQGDFKYSTDVGAFQVFAYVGDDILVCGNSNFGVSNSLISEMVLCDTVDGTELGRIDISEWWVSLADAQAGGQDNGWPVQHDVQDGNLIMGSWTCCMHQVIRPSAGEDDWNVWVNGNGDYIGDHNFTEDSEKPWVCNDYNVSPYMYSINLDSNQFSAFPCYDMGAVSFGLMGPDGTGIDYFAYAGETARGKICTEMVNYGSSYDGIYTDNFSSSETGRSENIWYVAYDSIKGVITNAVGVEEAPAGFAVAQNSPNPFNPTTTISFNIPEAGGVSVDVFNIAGQKVTTLANEFASAGSHSVVWDASGFSAGVYFYTVKAGDYSKTMKMTLIK